MRDTRPDRPLGDRIRDFIRLTIGAGRKPCHDLKVAPDTDKGKNNEIQSKNNSYYGMGR